MKLTVSASSLLLMAFVFLALLAGCGSRQQVPSHVSSHVSDADFSRYIQKYPRMGEAVRRGTLTKDAAYALRYNAPADQIMFNFASKVEAKRIEIYARHIPEAEKHRLLIEYARQQQMTYVNAANAAGRQAEQEDQASGHPSIAR